MVINKRGQIFFSAAKFYGHSGQTTLKRVPSTGRRENKCRQITIFLQAHFKGKQTNDLVSICYLIHGEVILIFDL